MLGWHHQRVTPALSGGADDAKPNVATILRDHVSLSTACIDRLYLNGYVPKLQTSGQLCAA